MRQFGSTEVLGTHSSVADDAMRRPAKRRDLTYGYAPSKRCAPMRMRAQGGIGLSEIGTITRFARLQSGLPFNPVVRTDINGDGRADDRAFVPSPATESDATTTPYRWSTTVRGWRARRTDRRRYRSTAVALNDAVQSR